MTSVVAYWIALLAISNIIQIGCIVCLFVKGGRKR